MKLEPTEAQRKAIIGFLSRPYPHYDPYKPDYEGWLDAFLAAANSIPEGPPVGTIARRPDGAWIADRRVHDDGEVYWLYSKGSFFELGDGKWPKPHDADSWPVIFAPNEVGSSEHSASDGDAYDPDLDWFPLGEEPVVPRPEPTEPIGPEIWRVAGWLEEHDDGEPYEIYTPDGSYG